jgi:hypothetical protein
VGLFHFLLTRSRQHRGVAFSLGGGVHPSAKTKAATSSPPVAAFFANPVNLARLGSCWGFEGPALNNFVRIHKTLRTTPAMAAKVTERLWEIGDIVGVLEAWEVAQMRRSIWEEGHGMV